MSETRFHTNNVISMDDKPSVADEFAGIEKQAKIDMNIDKSAIEQNTEKEYDRGRVHVQARSAMPEKQLFARVKYQPQNAERTGYSNYSYWKSVWHNFLKKKAAVTMLLIFIALFAFTFIGAAIGKYDVYNLRTDTSKMFIAPNSEYWFGTDNLGRDFWAQVWYATRTSILMATGVSVGQILLGVIAGLLWGYIRKLDRPFTELYNFINNVPTIIYMTLIALFFGKSFFIMAVALVGVGWLGTARNIRNLVFMYRDREYNLASRCLGTGVWRILIKNILPYLVSVIILRLALAIPGTISYETTLTYLGLMDISMPSLGILLRNARSYFLDYPYLLIFPASIVSVITITFYLVGNAISDACDPRNHV